MSSLVRRTNLLVALKTVEGVDQVWKYGADAATLDLRDVHTEALDQKARKWIRISIRFAAFGGAEVFAGVGGQRLDQELEAAVWPGVAGVALYGAESGVNVIQASDKLEALERNRGISSGSLEVIPVLETALGVWNVRKIITASHRVKQVALDEAALCLDLSIVPQEEYDPLVYARGRVVIEATAAGVQPLDAPHPLGTLKPELSEADLIKEGTRTKDLGFKGAIFTNRSWVEPFSAAFSPTQEQVDYYAEVRRVFAEGVARGTAAVPFQGRMVDVPVDEWAKAILERAAQCSARDHEKLQALEKAKAA